jgi:Flp pilus assembly protein TadB
LTGNPQPSTPQPLSGLSDRQQASIGLSDQMQALIVLVSAVLIAVGGVSVPAGLPTWVSLFFSLIGAAGLGIKEALGAKPTPQPKS